MYWTQRWFLGLEKFLVKALHLVDGQSQGQRGRTWLHKWALTIMTFLATSGLKVASSQMLPWQWENGLELRRITVNDSFVQDLGWVTYAVMFEFWKSPALDLPMQSPKILFFYLLQYLVLSQHHDHLSNSMEYFIEFGRIWSTLSLLPRKRSECKTSLCLMCLTSPKWWIL